MIELKGITWDHARGYDPVVATAEAYRHSHPDVRIIWQKRSLKEFGDFPIEKLAETFDLLIIDHPFVGFGAASTGGDLCATPDVFVSRQVGRYALGVMIELKEICHPESINWNPIMTYNCMSSTDEIVYCPLGFGYTNYGRKSFAPKPLNFANIPRQPNSSTSQGAILGGTGFAISSRCQHIPEAVDYAVFTASPDVQRGLYFDHGGQPGHRSDWLDERANAACNNFFKNTLDNSYLRPRYNGYMWLQETAWYAMHDFLAQGGDLETMLDTLDDLYRQSLTRKAS